MHVSPIVKILLYFFCGNAYNPSLVILEQQESRSGLRTTALCKKWQRGWGIYFPPVRIRRPLNGFIRRKPPINPQPAGISGNANLYAPLID